MTLTTNVWSAGKTGVRASIYSIVMVAGLMLGTQAKAQIIFDVIGPQEYNLPVNFDPFNVFVQYGMVQNDSKFWDADGNKVTGSGARRTIGLSKYVHFWTPDFNRNIGMAWEVIQPEVSVRDRSAADPDARNLSGFGDTITGFATWFKPTPKSTLGLQSFVQIPWGDKDVSDTNWKNYTTLLWYTPIGPYFDWTGDAGFLWQSPKVTGVQPGTSYFTNNRFGWLALSWLEPFVALDYEHTDSFDNVPESWSWDGGIGLMLFTYEGQSITARYSTSLKAENHSHNNSWNLKYVYTW